MYQSPFTPPHRSVHTRLPLPSCRVVLFCQIGKTYRCFFLFSFVVRGAVGVVRVPTPRPQLGVFFPCLMPALFGEFCSVAVFADPPVTYCTIPCSSLSFAQNHDFPIGFVFFSHFCFYGGAATPFPPPPPRKENCLISVVSALVDSSLKNQFFPFTNS